MGWEGAGRRRWFGVAFWLRIKGFYIPVWQVMQVRSFFKGCWRENVISPLKKVLLFASELCIYSLTSPKISLSEN